MAYEVGVQWDTAVAKMRVACGRLSAEEVWALAEQIEADKAAGRGVPDARVPVVDWFSVKKAVLAGLTALTACRLRARHNGALVDAESYLVHARVLEAFVEQEDAQRAAVPDAPLEPPPLCADDAHLFGACQTCAMPYLASRLEPPTADDIAWATASIARQNSTAAVPAALRAPREWQSIDSAPKDGTRLLLGAFHRTGVWLEHISNWEAEPNDGDPGWIWWCYPEQAPTHWQPLPAPPVIGAAADAASRRPRGQDEETTHDEDNDGSR